MVVQKSVKKQFHIFTIPLLTSSRSRWRAHPQHSSSVGGNQKCRFNYLYTFFFLFWSSVCYQVTEAWLAPFVCGGLFCPVPYMEDRGGLYGGWSHIHPMKLQFNICEFGLYFESELKQKSLNFSSSQEIGIMCPVYQCLFLTVWFILLNYFPLLFGGEGLFFFFLHADYFGGWERFCNFV